MSFADERKAIETRMAQAWQGSAYSAVPVLYQNDGKKPPNNAPYLVLWIKTGEGQQITLGSNPTDRYAGLIIVDVLVPEGSGSNEAKLMADFVSATFKRASFSSGASGLIRCRVPYLDALGAKHGWERFQLSVPYDRDVT